MAVFASRPFTFCAVGNGPCHAVHHHEKQISKEQISSALKQLITDKLLPVEHFRPAQMPLCHRHWCNTVDWLSCAS